MPYPCLISLATAVPEYSIYQNDIENLGRRLFKKRPRTFERLSRAYVNAGIDRRYSCVPLQWYEEDHGWKDRTRLFVKNALNLLQRSALEAINKANLTAEQIDGVIMVTSTGLAVPSLDAMLMERIPFRRNIQRLPIFGLGCGGGILGLSRAASLAQASPGSHWLVLIVELCGLTFRAKDLSKSNIIATALFGDGAAAGIVQVRDSGNMIVATGEHCWPQTLDIMGWNIEEDGFGVKFSQDIPQLVRQEMRKAAAAFCLEAGTSIESINQYVFHPGGAKVLTALEETFTVPAPGLKIARHVLRNYGNMSSATILFVLQAMLKDRMIGRSLLGALGPGFTAGFAIMEHN